MSVWQQYMLHWTETAGRQEQQATPRPAAAWRSCRAWQLCAEPTLLRPAPALLHADLEVQAHALAALDNHLSSLQHDKAGICRCLGRPTSRAHTPRPLHPQTTLLGCTLARSIPRQTRGPRTFLAAMAKKGGKRNRASTRVTSSAFFGRGTEDAACGAAAVPLDAAWQRVLLRHCGTLVACSGQVGQGRKAT